MATPEKKVKDTVKKLLEGYKTKGGKLWYFMPPANGYGAFGTPDFIGCYNGLFFAVETKAPAGTVTKLQQLVHSKIDDAGGTVFVVYGDDLAELGNWLDENYVWA